MNDASQARAGAGAGPGYELTPEQARRFVLRWQGLAGARRFSGAAGVLAYVRQAGCVQFDPVDVCGKNAEIALFSRVAGFKKETLESLLYKRRALVEHWDKNMAIFPAEDWPHQARNRRAFRSWSYTEESFAEVQRASGAVRDFVREKQVACSRDLDLGAVVDWPWAPARLSRAVLETLYFSGELLVHHRQGSQRYYAFAENLLPAALLAAPEPQPDDDDYYAWHTARRIAALGLLWNRPSSAFLGIPGYSAALRAAAFRRLEAEGRILPCRVQGLADTLYCPAEARPFLEEALAGRRCARRLEFIAPLDALMWDRKLVRTLFAFDYTWEIYTPKNKRKYGHYVLPVLYGDGFAGRVQLLADRPAGVLRGLGFWPEAGHRPNEAFSRALVERLHAFAAFNGCHSTELLPELFRESGQISS